LAVVGHMTDQELKAELMMRFWPQLQDILLSYHRYYSAGHCESYLVIEGPQIELGRAIVDFLGIAPPKISQQSQEALPSLDDNHSSVSNREPLSDLKRWQIFQRDNFTCQNCGSRSRLTVDHKIPRLTGGSNDDDNLQTLCKPCNSKKGARV